MLDTPLNKTTKKKEKKCIVNNRDIKVRIVALLYPTY